MFTTSCNFSQLRHGMRVTKDNQFLFFFDVFSNTWPLAAKCNACWVSYHLERPFVRTDGMRTRIYPEIGKEPKRLILKKHRKLRKPTWSQNTGKSNLETNWLGIRVFLLGNMSGIPNSISSLQCFRNGWTNFQNMCRFLCYSTRAWNTE